MNSITRCPTCGSIWREVSTKNGTVRIKCTDCYTEYCGEDYAEVIKRWNEDYMKSNRRVESIFKNDARSQL